MRLSRDTRWTAYGAAVWAFAFAALSAYWALGGEVGRRTIAADIARIPLANDLLVVWATAGLKGWPRCWHWRWFGHGAGCSRSGC